MHTFLTISQGIGLAAACGIRPFLPAVLAGGLAASDTGLDFDGTDFAFLESTAFLIALVVALAATLGYERRRPGAFQAGPACRSMKGTRPERHRCVRSPPCPRKTPAGSPTTC